MSACANSTRRAVLNSAKPVRSALSIRSAHTLTAARALAAPSRPLAQPKMTSILAQAKAAARAAYSALASNPEAKAGDAVPSFNLKLSTKDKVDLSTLKGKNLLVTVPGAFTSTCHAQIPGYISNYDKFKAAGLEDIYVLAVNDVFVVDAWKENLGGDKLKFGADDQAQLAAALGLVLDATAGLGGPRFKRSVILIEDGKIKNLIVEPDSGKTTVTGADEVLKTLKQAKL